MCGLESLTLSVCELESLTLSVCGLESLTLSVCGLEPRMLSVSQCVGCYLVRRSLCCRMEMSLGTAEGRCGSELIFN